MVSLILLAVGYSAEATSVLGVRHTLAEQLRSERLTIYLTQGSPTGLCLSGKASGRVLRYQSDALRAEAVTATFDPKENCWRIDQPATGYGYFVEHTDALPEYTYLIDYTAHQPKYETLVAEIEPADPCAKVRLTPGGNLNPMIYYTPSGVRRVLPFKAELKTESLRWEEAARHFSPYTHTEIIEYNTTPIEVAAALADTPYTLSQDLWARELGLPTRSISSASLECQRIELHAGIELGDSSADPDWQQLSAPSTLRLWARGNEPATAKYQWRIERLTPEGAETVLNYAGDEVEHTLSQSGQYRIRLEGINRSASCMDNSFEEEIRITESSLEVPNAFSPGSTPGVNDTFRVSYRSLTSFSGKVFSSSGQELYHWTDPNSGWDGRYRGQLVPTGAYYYAIDAVGADDIRYEKRGVVHVLRSEFDTF